MDYAFLITTGIGLAGLVLAYMQYRIMKSTVPAEQGASRSLLRRYWPIWVMAFLMVGNWIPYWWWANRAPQEPIRMPNIFRGWGGNTAGCQAMVDTSWLVEFRDKQRFFLICRLDDPTIDPGENKKIAISKPFKITGGTVRLSITFDSESEIGRAIKLERGVKPELTFHSYIATLPDDQDGSQIKTLSDVKRYGGQLISPGSLLK